MHSPSHKYIDNFNNMCFLKIFIFHELDYGMNRKSTIQGFLEEKDKLSAQSHIVNWNLSM